MDSVTQRKKDENQLAQEGRLPPGQSLTYKFPVLHYGRVPEFDPDIWNFRVWGDVEQELTWTWDEFNSLPRTSVVMDIHCVTRWSKFDTVWEGVSVRALVEGGFISLGSEAKFVVQHAENDYLEFASEFGLGALALLAFCVLASLWVAIRAQLIRRNGLMKGMGFTAAMAILALLIHSSADFNLQIPANAALFMVILALAWVARHCEHRRPSS